MVTVFLLRCTFFKFFNGAFTHSWIATRTTPGHCSGIICAVSGIIRVGSSITVQTPAWSLAHQHIRDKKSNLRNFPSRSTRMKHDLCHLWKAPGSFRVVTGSPVLRPASSGCELPDVLCDYTEGTRRLSGVIRIIFSSVYSGTEN